MTDPSGRRPDVTPEPRRPSGRAGGTDPPLRSDRVQRTSMPEASLAARTAATPRQRPWVGPRFGRGLLVAIPLGIALWLVIAWAVSRLFS